MGDTPLSLGNRKLVVLGIPWDVDTDGLKRYMSKYGAIDDIVVMKDRGTGRSRGFGYVTFSSAENAEKALATKHVLNGRLLEVKVATPKEDMKAPSKKITRIFVARIPSQVNEEMFRSYFEKFGAVTDVYMPKDQSSKSHRGIGFITFENSESVDKIMAETHEIGGSTIAVDKATPKDDPPKYTDKGYTGAYGAYSPYIAAATSARFGSYGLSHYPPFNYAGSGPRSNFGPAGFGSGFGGNSWSDGPPFNNASLGGISGPTRTLAYGSGRQSAPARFGAGTQSNAVRNSLPNKIFVGKLPSEITSDDLRRYFSNFGRILDVYLPKDSKKPGHRGFSFVTFADEGPAQRVTRRSHELLGHQIVVEPATPQDEAGFDSTLPGIGSPMAMAATGVPIRGDGSTYSGSNYRGGFDYTNGWDSFGGGGGTGPIMAGDRVPYVGGKPSRIEQRYKPY